MATHAVCDDAEARFIKGQGEFRRAVHRAGEYGRSDGNAVLIVQTPAARVRERGDTQAQALHEGLEARVGADGVEVAVVLQPAPVAHAGPHGPLEAIEGLLPGAGGKGRDYGWNPVPGYNEQVPMTDQSLPGKQIRARWRSGNPTLATSGGFTAKAGRFLAGVGYLNEIHPHAWDFADAPLANKVFLGNQLGEDGVQIKWVAPTSLYFDVGMELGRGRKFPAGPDNGRNGGSHCAGGHHVCTAARGQPLT